MSIMGRTTFSFLPESFTCTKNVQNWGFMGNFFKMVCALLAVNAAVFAQEKLTIDQAIAESMKNIAAKLPAGTKLFVFGIETESPSLSEYIIDESSIYIINNTKLSLVDNEIKALFVISGSFSKLGENYRFRIQAVNSADGQVQAIQSLSVVEDAILIDLLSTKSVPRSVDVVEKNTAVKQDTINVEKVQPTGRPNLSIITQTTFRKRYRNVNVYIDDELVAENLQFSRHRLSVPYGSHTIRATNEEHSATRDILLTEEGVSNRVGINSSRTGLSLMEFWVGFVGVGYQQFSDFYPEDNSYYMYNYDSHIVSPSSFYLEFGTIHRSSRFTYSVLFNSGPGNLGYGVFLGGTTSGSKVFKFRGGIDLGIWAINTQTLENGIDVLGKRITYGRVRENVMFGGPHINFLVGHNPIFASISLKVPLGIYEEYDMATYDYDYSVGGAWANFGGGYDMGFSAMFTWNLGLTFIF